MWKHASWWCDWWRLCASKTHLTKVPAALHSCMLICCMHVVVQMSHEEEDQSSPALPKDSDWSGSASPDLQVTTSTHDLQPDTRKKQKNTRLGGWFLSCQTNRVTKVVVCCCMHWQDEYEDLLRYAAMTPKLEVFTRAGAKPLSTSGLPEERPTSQRMGDVSQHSAGILWPPLFVWRTHFLQILLTDTELQYCPYWDSYLTDGFGYTAGLKFGGFNLSYIFC